MKIVAPTLFLSLILPCSPAFSQGLSTAYGEGVETSPGISESKLVSVGNVMIEQYTVRYVSGVAPIANLDSSPTSAKPLQLQAGAEMEIRREKKDLKACAINDPWNCSIDDDGDGTFDRISSGGLGKAVPLVAKVPYKRIKVAVAAYGAFFKKTYSFLGSSGGQIRIAYQEFYDHLARPAFNQEFTIDTPVAFPAIVSIKNMEISIKGITAQGITFEILAVK
jgi:hypothetical protein